MKTKRKSIRCLLGFHRWKIVGYSSVLNPLPVEQCERCDCGRQFHMMGGEMRWTPEQMREATKKK